MKIDRNRKCWCVAVVLMVVSFAVLGQTLSSQGIQTFSPYTPEQLKSFNDQKISPVEGVFGPVDLTQQQINLQAKQQLNSKSFNVPVGEQEAEVLETESAEPYQPMTPVITF